MRKKRNDDLLTVKEIAKICKVAVVTARLWLYKGKVEARKYGHIYLARRDEVERFKEEWKAGAYPVGRPIGGGGVRNGKDQD